MKANNDPNLWRPDDCRAWMKRDMYGNRESEYGWEIDDINPDGGDDLSNFRSLQWKKKLDKADGKLKYNVTANGISNLNF